MTATKEMTTVAFRTDRATKRQAEELFAAMGINLSAAINLFLAQSIRERQLPFQPGADVDRVPTRRLEAALMESDEILAGKRDAKSYESFGELLEDL